MGGVQCPAPRLVTDSMGTYRATMIQIQRWNPAGLRGRWGFFLLAALVAGLVALPVGSLLGELLNPATEVWIQLWTTTLPRMLVNTLLLMAGVACGTLLLGIGLAWLVTAYQFPLRGLFDKALLLPLAVPTFVMGFVYMATFDYAGPVQTFWRSLFGRGADFPDIRSGWGAALVMTLVLYPYVYLLARAAFREQGASTFEAAQVMGYSRAKTFFKLVLPLARPSIIAGVTLALMESMTDFATVRFFSFPTLSEGIVRTWEGRMDRAAATEVATLMLFLALALILLERTLRRRARYDQTGGRGRRPVPARLAGWQRWAAFGVCAAVLGVAFVLPVGQLVAWTAAEINGHIPGTWETVFGQYIFNSSALAGAAALVTVLASLLVAHGARTQRSRLSRVVVRLATLGYAMPGAVVAAGVLVTLAPVDHALADAGIHTGMLLTGSVTGLVYAYVVRFMSVAYNSVEASLEKVKPSMEQAARTMGARPARILWRVQFPLVRSGVAAGAILVFVDVMKELPATLLLRPFGMDTLAIWAYMLAAEAFWQAAALPALTILLVGLIPVILLMRVGSR